MAGVVGSSSARLSLVAGVHAPWGRPALLVGLEEGEAGAYCDQVSPIVGPQGFDGLAAPGLYVAAFHNGLLHVHVHVVIEPVRGEAEVLAPFFHSVEPPTPVPESGGAVAARPVASFGTSGSFPEVAFLAGGVVGLRHLLVLRVGGLNLHDQDVVVVEGGVCEENGVYACMVLITCFYS